MGEGGFFDRSARLIATVRDAALLCFAVIGGVWALFRFISIDSVEARLLYERQKRLQEAKLQINIEINDRSACVDGRFVTYGQSVITNAGQKTIVFDWDASAHQPVSVAKIDPETLAPQKDRIRRYNIYNQDGDVETSISVEAGRKTSVPFAVRFDGAGLFLLSFGLPVPEAELDDEEKRLSTDWDYYEQKIVTVTEADIACSGSTAEAAKPSSGR